MSCVPQAMEDKTPQGDLTKAENLRKLYFNIKGEKNEKSIIKNIYFRRVNR